MTLPALAQTPGASPVATPASSAMALFAELRETLLTDGRALASAFLAGDDDSFSPLLHPDSGLQLSASEEIAWLETNRVRMLWHDLNVLLDGQFDGSTTMLGYFYQGSATTFELTAEGDQQDEVPTGRWTGIVGPGTIDLEIAIEFSGSVDDLGATLDIPSQELTDFPLPDVSFYPSLPIGDLIQDDAMPLGGPNDLYRAEYQWGEAMLVLSATRARDGGFLTFQVLATLPLPPDPAEGFASDMTYQLPADGELLVGWGGQTEFQNYHATTPAQRHALDILAWEDGATFSGDGTTNEQYHIWGRTALAPVAGTVVTVDDQYPDIEPLVASMSAGTATPIASPVAGEPATHPAGNHVVIQAGETEYLFYGHLQQGSIQVAEGDQVQAGDPIGLVGNSGNTSEPHIHIHVQTERELFLPEAYGLPMVLTGYSANDEPVDEGMPVRGQFIQKT
jgi:hypothetical protein